MASVRTVPIKSVEMASAAMEEVIFKGKGHVHSLTFHESQKRIWGIYLLEASQLLQGVHQSVRQKWKKDYSLTWCPSPKNPYQVMEVLLQVSYPRVRKQRRLLFQAGRSHRASIWQKHYREVTKDQGADRKFYDFMGIIVHKGNKIKLA